VLKEHTVVR